jgi:hypothetical protein
MRCRTVSRARRAFRPGLYFGEHECLERRFEATDVVGVMPLIDYDGTQPSTIWSMGQLTGPVEDVNWQTTEEDPVVTEGTYLSHTEYQGEDEASQDKWTSDFDDALTVYDPSIALPSDPLAAQTAPIHVEESMTLQTSITAGHAQFVELQSATSGDKLWDLWDYNFTSNMPVNPVDHPVSYHGQLTLAYLPAHISSGSNWANSDLSFTIDAPGVSAVLYNGDLQVSYTDDTGVHYFEDSDYGYDGGTYVFPIQVVDSNETQAHVTYSTQAALEVQGDSGFSAEAGFNWNYNIIY